MKSLAHLRREMDRNLDIYRECKTLLNTKLWKGKEEMGFYMRLAENQLKGLSGQLEELNKRMKELSGS